MNDTIPVATLFAPDIPLPDPNAIRTAIDEADERARLLRRLLRVALCLQLHLVNGKDLRTTRIAGGEVTPV